MKEINDNYYYCNDCGALTMVDDMGEGNVCPFCGSEDIEFFEG